MRRPETYVGHPLEELDTPALVLDLPAFERNVAALAAFFAGRPAALRPHSKTHKCPQIALRQLAAGAIGITCAKLSEAEVMATAGVVPLPRDGRLVPPIADVRLPDGDRNCHWMPSSDALSALTSTISDSI